MGQNNYLVMEKACVRICFPDDTVDKVTASSLERMETKIDPQASAMVFSAMDFIVAGLVMVTSIIWFRSKHVARFYEACKVSRESVSC